MMNKNDHSISLRHGIRAAFFLALAFMTIQPADAQTQWVTNGNNINTTNTGNVGIGTAMPPTKLWVVDNSAEIGVQRLSHSGHAAFVSYPVATSATTPLWEAGLFGGQADYWIWNWDGTVLKTPFVIKTSGNVGIGTTNPIGLLHLRVSSGDVIQRLSNAGNGNGELDLRYKFESSQHRMGMTDTSGNWLFYTQYANPTTSAIGYFPGSVGIGTTAPSTKLHVVGDVTLAGTGNITASGTVTAGNIVAKYQDIAEWVPSLKAMPAGTVVVLDTVQLHHVMASSQAYDTRVAGVISERPGLILGEGGEGKLMVATTGRVRVKVDATRAPIRAGDILVTSDREGIAMRSEPIEIGGAKIHRPGTIIGKALEPLDKGIGEILVLLSLQ